MNLANDPWIPVQCAKGIQQLIAPWQITETKSPVVTLNAPRPDFNGALIQFLIGLLQTTATPETHENWLDWLEHPPQPEVLKQQFSQYDDAFELCSKQGSFMQDYEPLDGSSFNGIAELLIDSPGNNTIKENKDHFIKRAQIRALCPGCAATALFTLQTNAPSGGQGHRTSLRGGGPLTTLVVLDEQSDLPHDLWRNVWLNVLEQQQFSVLTGDSDKIEPADMFPWMAKTKTSEKTTGTQITPVDAHPLQMYWNMPRRIKIAWDSEQSGHCDICTVYSDALVTQYQTKNYGINYSGAWQHPLSPHSLNKSGDILPQHAQPGGMTYQHWLGFVDDQENHFSAAVVKRYRPLSGNWDEQLRLSVFGYDMDKMKARCWYQTTFPLFTIPENIRLDFVACIQNLTFTATEFAGFARTCVKDAWFKRPGDAKGDTTFLMQSFYQHTESAFFQTAQTLSDKLTDGTEKEVLHAWHGTLRKAVFELFDYWAARGDIAQTNPRRIADARNKLNKLGYSAKIRIALQLPSKPKSSKSREVAV